MKKLFQSQQLLITQLKRKEPLKNPFLETKTYK